jgi:hypothetical protein
VPRISFFGGIVILMFSNEGHHASEHFHARYADHSASIAFDGTVIAGSLPSAQLRLVRRWASLHQAELSSNWRRIVRGERVKSIDPLP